MTYKIFTDCLENKTELKAYANDNGKLFIAIEDYDNDVQFIVLDKDTAKKLINQLKDEFKYLTE